MTRLSYRRFSVGYRYPRYPGHRPAGLLWILLSLGLLSSGWAVCAHVHHGGSSNVPAKFVIAASATATGPPALCPAHGLHCRHAAVAVLLLRHHQRRLGQPLLRRGLFALLLAGMVTGISFAFFYFTGDRLREYKDETGAIPLRGLDIPTNISMGLAAGADGHPHQPANGQEPDSGQAQPAA
jgi:hypothetical protein